MICTRLIFLLTPAWVLFAYAAGWLLAAASAAP
jgi:hypothetical protein